MTRSLTWLLACAVAWPALAAAQSPYHVRSAQALPVLAAQEKDKPKEKEPDKPKDGDKQPKEMDKEKDDDKEKDTRKDEPAAAPPVMFPPNPYPAAAPAIMDPRFLGWQQVFVGPNGPYSNAPAAGPGVIAPMAVMGLPGAAAPAMPLVEPAPRPLEVGGMPAATKARSLPPAAPARVEDVLPPLPTSPEAMPAAPAASPEGKRPAIERTIDLVPNGRKGGWRISNGPR